VEKSWVNEPQEDCQCQQIIQLFSFKKQAGTFYITEIMWLGQVGLKFQLRYFVLVFKEDVKLEKFHCLPFFSLTLGLCSEKLPTLTKLCKYCTDIFKIILSTFFSKFN
jgi:hypothetical protein